MHLLFTAIVYITFASRQEFIGFFVGFMALLQVNRGLRNTRQSPLFWAPSPTGQVIIWAIWLKR
jgi:hypothetical protein